MIKFYETYKESKEAFYNSVYKIEDIYNVKLSKNIIYEDLSLDIAEIIPKNKDKLLFFMTGLHGIEGYVGDFLLREFLENYISKIDIENTHIIMAHSINPYGMKYYRKVNENNVDLNRNFVFDFNNVKQNKGYRENKNLFLPKKINKNFLTSKFTFYMEVLKHIIYSNKKDLKEATLFGQYEFEKGFFYGGKQMQKSSLIMKDLYNKCMEYNYKQRIFIDLHTGFGPKYQMSIVNSPYDKRKSNDLIREFDYPLIQSADGDDFYEINGDMINYLYNLIDETTDYATCFEFGTLGEGILSQIKSLRMMIQENSVYHYYNDKDKIYRNIKNDFKKLYMPNEEKWLKKVVFDFNKALDGILAYYKY